MMSYFVLGRCSCSNESNAPWCGPIATSRYTRGHGHTYPFAVDGHLGFGVDLKMGNFGDIGDAFHISRVTPCSKDARNLGIDVDVVRGN